MVAGMKSFTFQTTRSVLCEVGATAKIGEIMAGRDCRKVAFITDAMILKLGLAEPALSSLRAAGDRDLGLRRSHRGPARGDDRGGRRRGPGARDRWRRVDRWR